MREKTNIKIAIWAKLMVAKSYKAWATASPEVICGWKYISEPKRITNRTNPANNVVMAAVELTRFQTIPNKKTAVTGGAI